jgi:hypothetical protein
MSLDPADDRLWAADILHTENICDRAHRKWVKNGRFPPPDGNLNGRNYWLRATYERWRAEVTAGRYAQKRRPISITLPRRSKPRRAGSGAR